MSSGSTRRRRRSSPTSRAHRELSGSMQCVKARPRPLQVWQRTCILGSKLKWYERLAVNQMELVRFQPSSLWFSMRCPQGARRSARPVGNGEGPVRIRVRALAVVGVVQRFKTSAFQPEDTGSIPVTDTATRSALSRSGTGLDDALTRIEKDRGEYPNVCFCRCGPTAQDICLSNRRYGFDSRHRCQLIARSADPRNAARVHTHVFTRPLVEALHAKLLVRSQTGPPRA